MRQSPAKVGSLLISYMSHYHTCTKTMVYSNCMSVFYVVSVSFQIADLDTSLQIVALEEVTSFSK